MKYYYRLNKFLILEALFSAVFIPVPCKPINMKSILSVVAFLICPLLMEAQNTNYDAYMEYVETRDKSGDAVSEFMALRHGDYIEKYKYTTITNGTYDMGKRTGDWIFTDVDGVINYTGSYKEDLKDGLWSYFRNDTLVAELNFTGGEIEKVYGYFADGSTSYKQEINKKGNGSATSYYRNGKMKEYIPIENNTIEGVAKIGFENGKVFRTIAYKENKIYTVLKTNDQNGEPIDGGTLTDGSGTFIDFYTWSVLQGRIIRKSSETYLNEEKNGPFISYANDGEVYEKGQLLNGEKVGEWYTFAGDLVDTTFYKTPEKRKSAEEETIFERKIGYHLLEPEFERPAMGSFPGGDFNMAQFLSKNITYPRFARDAGLTGTVYVSFMVNIDGTISDAYIVRSPGKDLNKESLRVVRIMPRWTPAFKDGIPTPTRYNLPLNFTLR